MKKFLISFLMIAMLFVATACGNGDDNGDDNGDNGDNGIELDQALAAQFENLAVNEDVYITSIGRGEELDIIWTVLASVFDDAAERDATITLDDAEHVDDFLKASDVETDAVVFLIVGASSKGMGDAGTDQGQEAARAAAFTARAAAGEITIVLIHSGGATRRGTLSDPLIDAAAPEAALMLVLAHGNEDEYFNTLSSTHDVPLYLYTNNPALIPPLKQLFGK